MGWGNDTGSVGVGVVLVFDGGAGFVGAVVIGITTGSA